ncbi:hypothetical protein ACVWZA_000530 [Sphingomonas sp. UYAg733]
MRSQSNDRTAADAELGARGPTTYETEGFRGHALELPLLSDSNPAWVKSRSLTSASPGAMQTRLSPTAKILAILSTGGN